MRVNFLNFVACLRTNIFHLDIYLLLTLAEKVSVIPSKLMKPYCGESLVHQTLAPKDGHLLARGDAFGTIVIK